MRPVWVHSGIYVGVTAQLWAVEYTALSEFFDRTSFPTLQLITVNDALTNAVEDLLSTLFAARL